MPYYERMGRIVLYTRIFSLISKNTQTGDLQEYIGVHQYTEKYKQKENYKTFISLKTNLIQSILIFIPYFLYKSHEKNIPRLR